MKLSDIQGQYKVVTPASTGSVTPTNSLKLSNIGNNVKVIKKGSTSTGKSIAETLANKVLPAVVGGMSIVGQGASLFAKKMGDSGIIKKVTDAEYNYASKAKDALKGTLESFSKDISETASRRKTQSPGSTALQIAGAAAKGTFGAFSAPFTPAIQGVVNKISDIPAVQKVATGDFGEAVSLGQKDIGDKINQIKQKFPEASADIESLYNLALLYGGSKTFEPAGKMASEAAAPIVEETKAIAGDIKGATKQNIVDPLVRKMTYKTEQSINKDVLSYFKKGVKPSIRGQETIGKAKVYEGLVVGAADAINENKASLKFTTPEGETVAGKNPQNLVQFQDAIDQTKKAILKKYDALAKASGEAGGTVDVAKVVAPELQPIIQSKALAITNPKAIEYAKNLQTRLNETGGLDATTAQEVIQNFNEALKYYYRNPTYEATSQVAIDAMVANLVRKELDRVIESTGGTGYQALKNQYGALSTIERDVVHRNIVEARKNVKGLIDFTDFASGAELVSGLATMSPEKIITSGVIKVLQTYYKYLNTPNRAVKKMFDTIEKSQQQSIESATKATPTGKTFEPKSATGKALSGVKKKFKKPRIDKVAL